MSFMLQEDIYTLIEYFSVYLTMHTACVDCPTNINTAGTKTCKITISSLGS